MEKQTEFSIERRRKYGKKKYYVKWYPSRKKGMTTVRRLDSSKPSASATLMDGFVAGYKSGYVVVSKKKVRGWKLKKIR